MNKYFKLRIIALLSLTLLINLALFAILPHFIKEGYQVNRLPNSTPIDLIRIKPPKPPPPEEKEKKPQEKETKQKKTPKFQIDLSGPKKIKIDKLSFEINPKLVEGVPVAPPPELLDLTEQLPELTKPFYDLSEVDEKPVALLKLKPPYPSRARQFNMSGYVKVKFLVDKLGQVTRIRIVESHPEGVFDNTVRTTLPSWKFSPGKIEGEPVSTWVVTRIAFEME